MSNPNPDESVHGIRWADGGMVGLSCDGYDAGYLSAGEDPTPCLECGKMVKLVWDVRVEVVTPPGQLP